MRLRMFGATDKGLVRSANQDAYYCNAEWGVAIVSDGMGGHKGGERASQLTTEGLKDAFRSRPTFNIEDISAHLDETLQAINYEIHRIAQEDEDLHGMGATVNYLHFTGGHVAIGHAGDSRTYLIRAFLTANGETKHGMWQLTIDHNVESFVERGLFIPGRDIPDAPLTLRQKARLTRGMGVVQNLKADLYCKKLEDGDVFLTCSDGLHGFVSDRDVLQALITGPIARTPERLIALAIKAGAPDNVTVVISVASSAAEPLINCKGPQWSKPPFLARDASGQISQLISADKLIKKWMAFEISNEAEICSYNGKWVFLQKRNALIRTYPEFDTPAVRERLEHVVPQSAAGKVSSVEPRSTRRQSSSRTDSYPSRSSQRPSSARSSRTPSNAESASPVGTYFTWAAALLAIGGVVLLIVKLMGTLRLLQWQVY